MDYARALRIALAAAAEARQVLLAETRRPAGPRGNASKCPADVEAERLIRQRLLEAFPEWDYLGEETGRQTGSRSQGHVWLVDPNDGTASMHHGFRGHAVSIGLVHDGVPVLGVVYAVNAPDDEGECFAWAEGCGPLTRNGIPVERAPFSATLGSQDVVLVSQAATWYPAGNLALVSPARYRAAASIAYRLALVAAGEGCVAVSLNGPTAWDYAAGHALLRGVGGTLLDERSELVRYRADGTSSTQHCFGGGQEAAREIASRPWQTVTARRPDPSGSLAAYRPRLPVPGGLVHDPARLARAQGALLAQVAADDLGQLFEFASAEQIADAHPDGGPFLLEDGGYWDTIAGQPTDDSELALLLARTIVHRDGFDAEAVAASYARWAHGWLNGPDDRPDHPLGGAPFDIGNATWAALSGVTLDDLALGRAADHAISAAVAYDARQPNGNEANGALMRVSPIGIWGAPREPAEVAAAARADARITHASPVCEEASAVYAITIAAAVREGLSPVAAYEWALGWTERNCETKVVDVVRAAQTTAPEGSSGHVTVAIQNAFYQLLHAQSLADGVVATVRLGGDADTNAAICGALLGAVHGRDAIPIQWRRMVLSCRAMYGQPGVHRPRPSAVWPADALELAEALLLAGKVEVRRS